MKTTFIALSTVAAICLASSQASATVVTVTVTGAVNSTFYSSDWGTNPFSSINAGDPFKAVYTFDTAQAAVVANSIDASEAYGGASNGSGPFGHVDLTVGNQSYSFDGGYQGLIAVSLSNVPPYMQQSVISQNGTATTFDYIGLYAIEYGTFPVDFATTGIYDFVSGDPWFAELDVESIVDGMISPTGSTGLLEAQLQHVEISNGTPGGGGGGTDPTPAPEPASLSLLAGGLMGAPFFRRRSKKSSTA
jgi:hypothetical protein